MNRSAFDCRSWPLNVQKWLHWQLTSTVCGEPVFVVNRADRAGEHVVGHGQVCSGHVSLAYCLWPILAMAPLPNRPLMRELKRYSFICWVRVMAFVVGRAPLALPFIITLVSNLDCLGDAMQCFLCILLSRSPLLSFPFSAY